MKKHMKKTTKKEILVLFVIVLFVFMAEMLIKPTYDYDTFWTFSFASKIVNGYVPYRDYNMVQTPLFAQIDAIFLKIFGNNMLVFQGIGALYGTLIMVFTYLICKKMNFNCKLSVIISMLFYIFLTEVITPSYNILSLLLVYIILYVEICKIRYEKYVALTGKKKKNRFGIKITTLYNILLGTLLGLTFIAKQNIGAVTVLVITIYYFAKCFFIKEYKFRESFKQLVIMAVFCIIPIAIECIYLYANGALYNAIDYTILGIGHFGTNNHTSILKSLATVKNSDEILAYTRWFISIVGLIAFVCLQKMNVIKVKTKFDLNILVLSMLFLVIAVFVSIPLANRYHMIITITLSQFLFVINLLQISQLKRYIVKSISNLTYYLTIIIPVICAVYSLLIYSKYAQKATIGSLKGAFFPISCEYNINVIVNYMDNYEKIFKMPIYNVTTDGIKYSVATEKNNGIFDLPLYGNLGKEDYKAIINKFDSMEHFAVMIYNDMDKLFWQEPVEIMNYVKENYKHVDTFNEYDIYVKE